MSDMTVAKTILTQLGANKFLAMTGAKDLLGDDNSLRFKLPRSSKGVNYVKVTLDPSDTYTVEFGFTRAMKYRVVSSFTDIYFDQLQELFTRVTGLYTSLGTMGRAS